MEQKHKNQIIYNNNQIKTTSVKLNLKKKIKSQWKNPCDPPICREKCKFANPSQNSNKIFKLYKQITNKYSNLSL